MIYTFSVFQWVGTQWRTRWTARGELVFNPPTFFKKKDTGILVFSYGQQKQLEFFLQQKEIKVLFKGPQALNKQPGHQMSRNTIVVFEYA